MNCILVQEAQQAS